jgi:hypothetical protein
MTSCNASFTANLQLVYGWKSTSARLGKVSLDSFECLQRDID